MSSDIKKILCVDDDNDILIFLRTIFEQNGYAVLAAYSGDEGYKVYIEKKPDFVIVDLMMEEIDAGLNLAMEIRKVDKKTPIYMLSSIGNSLYSNSNIAELGLTGIFQKPLKPEILLETIKSFSSQILKKLRY